MSAPDPKTVEAAIRHADNMLRFAMTSADRNAYETLGAVARAYLRAPTAPQGAEPLISLEQMNADNLAGYDFAVDESMSACERVLDEVEQGKPLTGVSHPRWQKIRERIHALAAPQDAGIARDAARYRCLRPMLKTHFAILFKNVSDDEIDVAIDAVLTSIDAETKG